jgi:hypothetical protein
MSEQFGDANGGPLPSMGNQSPARSPRPAYKCQAVTQDGQLCRANARPSSGLCFVHDPDCREQVRAAGRKGAAESHRRRVLASETEPVQLETAEDVRAVLSDTIHKLRVGEMDRATAGSVSYACQLALRAIDVRDTQRRLDALEQKLAAATKGRR